MDGLLSDLARLVETLRAKIANPSGISNEAITRYSLIDPVLRGMGWDTEDPSVVVPEYSSGEGRADYALFYNADKPAIIVEAKKLGDSLEGAADQGIKYCVQEGIECFAVTDGNKWRVYETHKPVPIPDKLIRSFDVGDMESAEVCVKMLILWRRRIGASGIVAPVPPERPPPPGPEPSWKSITNVVYAVGGSHPTRMKFPDGSTAEIASWVEILSKTAAWLIKNKRITKDNCPVRAGRSQYVVAAKPMHEKRPFKTKQKIHNLYLERSFGPKLVLKHSEKLVRHAGLDPRNFELAP